MVKMHLNTCYTFLLFENTENTKSLSTGCLPFNSINFQLIFNINQKSF